MPARTDSDVIPLDARTRRWLVRLSETTGDEPRVLVAKLLRAIRVDDERAETVTH